VLEALFNPKATRDERYEALRLVAFFMSEVHWIRAQFIELKWVNVAR
jgi:hypothetical protein